MKKIMSLAVGGGGGNMVEVELFNENPSFI